jgi:hypothetical protein
LEERMDGRCTFVREDCDMQADFFFCGIKARPLAFEREVHGHLSCEW